MSDYTQRKRDAEKWLIDTCTTVHERDHKLLLEDCKDPICVALAALAELIADEKKRKSKIREYQTAGRKSYVPGKDKLNFDFIGDAEEIADMLAGDEAHDEFRVLCLREEVEPIKALLPDAEDKRLVFECFTDGCRH